MRACPGREVRNCRARAASAVRNCGASAWLGEDAVLADRREAARRGPARAAGRRPEPGRRRAARSRGRPPGAPVCRLRSVRLFFVCSKIPVVQRATGDRHTISARRPLPLRDPLEPSKP